MTDIEFTIEPPKGLVRIDWQELYRFRDLFLVLTWRDINVRYKQTALGVFWAILQPFLTMVVFSFIFNRIAGIKSGDGTPYPIFLYTGQLLWTYFSNTLNNASNSMVTNQSLVQKIYFPRLILPAVSALTGLVDFAIAFFIVIAMMWYYHFTPHLLGLLVLPLLIFAAFLCSIGLGMYAAAINVKYRDVRYALPFMISIMMYVTPVIYPVSMLNHFPVVKTLMLWLNPMSGIITDARAALLGKSPFDWPALAIALLMSTVYFIAGLYYFRSTERYFADIA